MIAGEKGCYQLLSFPDLDHAQALTLMGATCGLSLSGIDRQGLEADQIYALLATTKWQGRAMSPARAARHWAVAGFEDSASNQPLDIASP
jgi:hypothetical protein